MNGLLTTVEDLRHRATNKFRQHRPTTAWVTLVGPRKLKQLESAVRATESALSADVLKRLAEIFPGPGGEAPETYAL